MATHSSILAWETTEEPRGLQSMGPQRVRQDRAMEHMAQCALRPVKQTLNAGSLPGELSVSRGAYSRLLPCDLCLLFFAGESPKQTSATSKALQRSCPQGDPLGQGCTLAPAAKSKGEVSPEETETFQCVMSFGAAPVRKSRVSHAGQ